MELKKVIIGILVITVSLISFRVYSQSRKSTEEKVRRMTEKMSKRLQLTDAQKEQVYKINLQRAHGHQKAYEAGRKREVIVAAVQQWENELSEVLSEDQLRKLKINKGKHQNKTMENPKTLSEVKAYAQGEWQSITVELRPTEDRAGTGEVTPTFLKRHFTYLPNDKFVGVITLFGDNYGELPLMEFEFKGNLIWHEEHPIADGAWKIDYILDEGFGVTPLNPGAAAMLNQALPEGMSSFEPGVQKDILGKAFPMFHIVEGQVVGDYDLIYFKHGLLFMGAKHVDGTPFDKIENRPHQLQIPLERMK